jgi:alkylation response protein AidB-like acyl-CoA dehydrogenase
MRFAFDPEQEELRRTVRTLLERRSGSSDVREAMANESGYDHELWALMAEQIGAHSLAIPEEFGGAGFTLLETHIVVEELGAALTPSPFLGSAVLAAQAILATNDGLAAQRLLPGIASGETIAALAWAEQDGLWSTDTTATKARNDNGAWTLTGAKHHVLDAAAADVFIVVADTGEDIALFEVDAQEATLTPRASVDPTRRHAIVAFQDAPAKRLGTDGHGRRALRRTLDLACVALSADQVGGAQRALDLTVEYAKTRIQFGRPIGSFQAVKHRLADLYTLVESARSASYAAAAAAAAASENELALTTAAARAKAYCSEAYATAAGEAIQLHGGIGITWEHDIHLYFKRAHSSAQLFGSPAEHRRRYAAAVGLAA